MSSASVYEQGMSGKRDSRLTVTSVRHFYQGNNLHTHIQGSKQQSIFRTEHGLLAQLHAHDNRYDVGMICQDAKLSVSRVLKHGAGLDVAYAPYGYASSERLMDTLIGFNGQMFEQRAGCYLLGNGCRVYIPSLMRFGSSDSLSPFGKGWLSSYMYCVGDPVNFSDPSGHFRIGSVWNFLSKPFRSSRKPGKSQAVQETFVGYHGTSGTAAKKILKKGVESKTGTFFLTDTFGNADRYAALKKKGTVLAVSTVDFAKVKDNSARGLVRSKGINELRIERPAHHLLRFTRVSTAGPASDFDRFITLEDQMARDVQMFNARLRGAS
ncbi:RHS repeat-associated core domain-containing protein [Pseudomonas putida]|uniref:RHS repeat-associated core domain-containing protein n=1 Tax=Pseudomonas putida TaxID=303 RepID=UPI0018AB9474|nr:RHS repeat-associated core domain-containing protein [Pseudomonas putida]MBF8766250.1 RHS repeat-associated core domain-containing protein [Pseudomonas putida]